MIKKTTYFYKFSDTTAGESAIREILGRKEIFLTDYKDDIQEIVDENLVLYPVQNGNNIYIVLILSYYTSK